MEGKFAQAFKGDGSYLDSCKFFLGKVGNPDKTCIARLYAHQGEYGVSGFPIGSPLLSSDPIDMSSIPDSATLIKFNFPLGRTMIMEKDVPYILAIEYDYGSYLALLTMGIDVLGTPSVSGYGNMSYFSYDWAPIAGIACIYIYGQI